VLDKKNISQLLTIFIVFLSAAYQSLYAENDVVKLFQDLKIVEMIERERDDRLPYHYNYALMGGYFNMPSARMNRCGTSALGMSYFPPYRKYGATIQPLSRLECGISYQVFLGMPDPIMGSMGFGDFADRGANVKFGILRREDGVFYLPEIAIGLEDFYGTKRLHSFYAVVTQHFLRWNLEATVGWGRGRIRGFFGGIGWTPFRQTNAHFIKGLSVLAEYDGIDYAHHLGEHPKGREMQSRINVGLSATLFDFLQLSISSIRGKKMAASISLFCSMEDVIGLFPKTDNPPLYRGPLNQEAIGHLRSEKELAQELAFALVEQGLEPYQIYLTTNTNQEDALWIEIVNPRYRLERDFKKRVVSVLAALVPPQIKTITLVIQANGIPICEYRFQTSDLQRFTNKGIGNFEFHTLYPMRAPSRNPNAYEGSMIYHRKKKIWTCTIRPRLLAFFGSATGKFKYSAGIIGGPEGYFFDLIYYKIQGAYNIHSSLSGVGDRDMLNPSKIINVRSDTVRYYQTRSISIEQAYLQKGSYVQNGWYYRLALGYFEAAYGGISGELLYYPMGSSWAIGLEVAGLLKRKYHGLCFTTKVKQFDGLKTKQLHYIGYQCFLDLYYHLRFLPFDVKLSIGKFLARDTGARFELSRYFPSGLRLSIWYTWTNAKDIVNHKRYQDKGIAFAIPLDFFLKKSSRSMIPYAMSVWLRDTGARANTGKPLYPTLVRERHRSLG